MLIGIMRATSALASAIVTPGLSRARAVKLKPPRNVLLRSRRSGSISAGFRSRNRNVAGSTPMTSRARPSTSTRCPMIEGSPPNFERQYPNVSITVSGLPVTSVEEYPSLESSRVSKTA